MEKTRTEIVSIHKTRRYARRLERKLTEGLEETAYSGIGVRAKDGYWRLPQVGSPDTLLPIWTHGFRVRPAGRRGLKRQFVVEATSWKGH